MIADLLSLVMALALATVAALAANAAVGAIGGGLVALAVIRIDRRRR